MTLENLWAASEVQRLIARRFASLFGNIPATPFRLAPRGPFEQESRDISELRNQAKKSADLLAAASDALAIEYANRFLEYDECNALTWLLEQSGAEK